MSACNKTKNSENKPNKNNKCAIKNQMKKKKQIKSPVNLDDILHKEHATIVNAKATNELDWKNSKPNGMEKKMFFTA